MNRFDWIINQPLALAFVFSFVDHFRIWLFFMIWYFILLLSFCVVSFYLSLSLTLPFNYGLYRGSNRATISEIFAFKIIRRANQLEKREPISTMHKIIANSICMDVFFFFRKNDWSNNEAITFCVWWYWVDSPKRICNRNRNVRISTFYALEIYTIHEPNIQYIVNCSVHLPFGTKGSIALFLVTTPL